MRKETLNRNLVSIIKAIIVNVDDTAKEELKKLISAGADINILEDFEDVGLLERPIHFAIRRFNPDLIRFLLENGSDVNLTNDNFLTPIEILLEKFNKQNITENEVTEILGLLLSNRKPLDKSLLTKYIEICNSHAKIIVDKRYFEKYIENNEVIAFHASCLAGCDVAKLWRHNGNANTYAMQVRHTLELLRTSTPDYNSFMERGQQLVSIMRPDTSGLQWEQDAYLYARSGWFAEQFLALRIHLLMEVLIDICQKNSSNQNILQFLEDELSLQIESLRCSRDMIALRALPSESNRDQLYKILSESAIQKVESLKENSFCSFSIGWQGHEIDLVLEYRTLFHATNSIFSNSAGII